MVSTIVNGARMSILLMSGSLVSRGYYSSIFVATLVGKCSNNLACREDYQRILSIYNQNSGTFAHIKQK